MKERPIGYEELPQEDQQKIHYELLDKWWARQRSKPSIFLPRWASRITLFETLDEVEIFIRGYELGYTSSMETAND